MFAFLIWDSQERVLFGARDWFGIKPLFTYADERGTFFASEKKSLLDVAAGRRGRRRRRHRAAALPDPAVRPRAGVDAHARSAGSSPAPTSRCARASSCAPHRYFHPDFAIKPVPDEDKLYREIAEALEDSVGQAHARRRHRRLVPVRRHRLHRHRRAGQAAQPEAADVHHRLRARGLQRDRRRRRVGRRDRRRAHHQGRQRRGDDGDAAADRLVPRRPGRRPGARAAVLHRPRGPQARQGRAVRRGRRRAVRRLHDLPRADLAARRSTTCRARPRRGLGKLSTRIPEGTRGKDLLRRGAIGIEERYYGNARIFRPDEMRGSTARYDPAVSYMDVTRELYDADRRTSTTRPACSTSTCSPGCAATSSSRPTR